MLPALYFRQKIYKLYITETKNNTFISIIDCSGKIITQYSGGMGSYSKKPLKGFVLKKSSNTALLLCKFIILKLKKMKCCKVKLYICTRKKFGKNLYRQTPYNYPRILIHELLINKIKVLTFLDRSAFNFNGCRKYKKVRK